MTIIAVSDVHLGYKNCDKKSFKDFLDYVAVREDITDFVILGDFLDMWRRDIAGFTMSQEITTTILYI
jgi:UDP-2,3-diacylglucosamine pyrophosphatase LpxH